MLFFGLDFGQAADYTALAIVQPVTTKDRQFNNGTGAWDEQTRTELHVRHLERFKLRTPYPDIVDRVAQRVKAAVRDEPNPIQRGVIGDSLITVIGQSYVIAADATGVGAPVVDLLRRADLQTISITITGGQKANYDRGYHVPKRDLIAAVQVMLQQGRLKFADGLPEVQTLVKELLSMQVKINTETAHDSYGAWREGSHDDLALAVAMATWLAQRTGGAG